MLVRNADAPLRAGGGRRRVSAARERDGAAARGPRAPLLLPLLAHCDRVGLDAAGHGRRAHNVTDGAHRAVEAQAADGTQRPRLAARRARRHALARRAGRRRRAWRRRRAVGQRAFDRHARGAAKDVARRRRACIGALAPVTGQVIPATPPRARVDREGGARGTVSRARRAPASRTRVPRRALQEWRRSRRAQLAVMVNGDGLLDQSAAHGVRPLVRLAVVGIGRRAVVRHKRVDRGRRESERLGRKRAGGERKVSKHGAQHVVGECLGVDAELPADLVELGYRRAHLNGLASATGELARV